MKKIARESLYVSEPPPQYFGNGPNEEKDPAWTNGNWLKSRFHFAFAEYGWGPSNFGALRVMNDDLVQPKRGFGTHPHQNMEIVTYVVQGALTHKDSRGNEETLGRGSLQYMSAGRGIQHSEDNPGAEPVRFIQSWIVPRARGLEPNYGSLDGSAYELGGEWSHLVADHDDDKSKAPVRLHQDVNMFVAEFPAGADPSAFPLKQGRQAYLLCVEGAVRLETADGQVQNLVQHDAAQLHGPLPGLTVAPADGNTGHVLLFEMAQS